MFWYDWVSNVTKSAQKFTPVSFLSKMRARSALKPERVISGLKRMDGIIKIWWNLTSAAIFYYSSLISKSIWRKDRNLWSRDRFCSALAKKPKKISCSDWSFAPQTAARLANYKTINVYRGLHYSYWFYWRFARVEIYVELWSIRCMECCFERNHLPSPSREAGTFVRKTRVKMPDVFAEWFCADAHYIIATGSYPSLIFHGVLIGIYELRVQCLSWKSASWSVWA